MSLARVSCSQTDGLVIVDYHKGDIAIGHKYKWMLEQVILQKGLYSN